MSVTSDILKLKKEKNAVILAHYYVDEDVQEVADYVGDSFYLSKVATKVDQDIIVFAGVEFMGESAKILNPKKKVLMPEPGADCPMAHMATKEEILKMREQYDDLAVVCYINSTAEDVYKRQDRNIVTMLLIFITAGIFVGVVGRSSAESVAYFMLSIIPAKFAVAVLFIVACFVSTAMGTSVGTITLITPIAVAVSEASGFSMALCVASVSYTHLISASFPIKL